jgi:hypothetical protein
MSIQEIEVLSVSRTHSFDVKTHLNSIRYVINRIFSCWHIRMSRPFTHERESYRTCLRCGMRRSFDVQKWKSRGRFYSPTIERKIE